MIELMPRKTIYQIETIAADGFGQACTPVTRVAAMAVFRNPLSGRNENDLSELFQIGSALGSLLAPKAIELLGKPAVSYGKAALVGVSGDMEHGGAVIHPMLGAPMRQATGGGEAVISSNVKVAPVGAAIDVPIGHKDNAWSFDHFDTMTLMVADAPRPDEIVICLVYSDGGRPIPRCGSGPASK